MAIERPGTSGTPSPPTASSSLDRLVMVKKRKTCSPADLFGLVRIGLHPFADALHRHFVLGHDPAIDEHAADRRIWPAVMGIVIDAQNGAVFQPDAGRALDLRKQHVDLAAQPADFQMPAVERAILDLAAV